MNYVDVANDLLALSESVGKASTAAASIASTLLRFAAVIVQRGGDPIDHLSRLADLDPGFDAASKSADAAAHVKFDKDPQ